MNGTSPLDSIMPRANLPEVPAHLKRFTRPVTGADAGAPATKGNPPSVDASSAGATPGAVSPAAAARTPARSEFEKFFPGLATRPDHEAHQAGRVASGQINRGPDIRSEIARDQERKKLYDAAVEFQSIFVKMMLNSMRKTLNKENDPLHGGQTQEIFEDMLYDKYAMSMSQTAGFPLADWIYRDLTRNLPPAGAGGPTPTMERGGRAYDINLPKHSPGISSGQIRTRPDGL